MRGSTFLLGLSSFKCRGENLPFCFSLSIRFLFFPPLVCFPSFFFFFFFHFLFYFFFFLFSFLLLMWIASTKWSKSGGNFPPLSSIAACHHHYFSLNNFSIFLLPLFPSFDTWLNVSHSHKCTTWIMPSHSPRVPCDIHMIMPCVTRHPMPRKREISTVSESDEIRRGN